MATFSVIPSPHLISVSHGRVVLSSRGRRSSAVSLVSSYISDGRCIIISPSIAVLFPRVGLCLRRWISYYFSAGDLLIPPVRPLSSLVEGRLAFVRYRPVSTDNDAFIVMMSPFSRCWRLPHATPPFLGEDKASLWFVSRLRMVSVPPLVSSRPCPRRSHEKYKISAQLEMSMYSCRGALHGSPPFSSITVWTRDQRECLATQADI